MRQTMTRDRFRSDGPTAAQPSPAAALRSKNACEAALTGQVGGGVSAMTEISNEVAGGAAVHAHDSRRPGIKSVQCRVRGQTGLGLPTISSARALRAARQGCLDATLAVEPAVLRGVQTGSEQAELFDEKPGSRQSPRGPAVPGRFQALHHRRRRCAFEGSQASRMGLRKTDGVGAGILFSPTGRRNVNNGLPRYQKLRVSRPPVAATHLWHHIALDGRFDGSSQDTRRGLVHVHRAWSFRGGCKGWRPRIRCSTNADGRPRMLQNPSRVPVATALKARAQHPCSLTGSGQKSSAMCNFLGRRLVPR